MIGNATWQTIHKDGQNSKKQFSKAPCSKIQQNSPTETSSRHHPLRTSRSLILPHQPRSKSSKKTHRHSQDSKNSQLPRSLQTQNYHSQTRKQRHPYIHHNNHCLSRHSSSQCHCHQTLTTTLPTQVRTQAPTRENLLTWQGYLPSSNPQATRTSPAASPSQLTSYPKLPRPLKQPSQTAPPCMYNTSTSRDPPCPWSESVTAWNWQISCTRHPASRHHQHRPIPRYQYLPARSA